MTTEQALAILDEAASAARLPRIGHVNVQRAVEVLREAIKPKEDEAKE